MNNLQKRLKDMVLLYISGRGIIDEKEIDNQIEIIKMLPDFSILSSAEVWEVRSEITSEILVKLDKGHLIKEKGHEKWFLNKKSQLDMKYWNRYKTYLTLDKGFPVRVVNNMDDVLDSLVDLLGDPSREIHYKRRGLIIGDVQSGKTANYIGLICKAVDSGYKVIVLLTGTIEKLRQQTQKRVDEGFVGADSNAMINLEEDERIIGVGKRDQFVGPMVLTSTKDDFKSQNARNLNFDLRNINGPVIFVTKKNTSILKSLNKWLKTFNKNGEEPIDHSLLVVDDEADNASINYKKEDSPTAINFQIRELLKMFSKSSYVGFTATPYANIFVDPSSYNDMVEEDLFPKDYIYSLNAPSNYTGARDIFGDDGQNCGMLVEIDDNIDNAESIARLLPLKHKESWYIDRLPHDLKKAIASFILANAIEDLRGISGNHRSMLVNISRFMFIQEQISYLINDFLKSVQASVRSYSKMDEKTALKNECLLFLKETYEEIYNDIEFEWKEIQNQLNSSSASIIVRTINTKSDKKLNYDEYKDGLRVIAVGGMSLSRGLTLEGLVISYFYRNSKMYDTLMQMGRWFGYRDGYADLCKIWMSEESISWYSYISKATDELRREVKRYQDSGLTPKDFGLRVRSDLTSLIVTARNKMKDTESRECLISLSGVCIETPEIYSDTKKNNRNLELVKQFVDQLCSLNYEVKKSTNRKTAKFGFKDVSMETVVDFIERLEISPKNAHFDTNVIKSFIDKYEGNELKAWDIAFATGTSTDTIDLGHGIIYNYPRRSYKLENNDKILKMSGSKRRLGASADGMYGLDEEKREIIKKRSIYSGKSIPQSGYFTDIDRNPLLTIYVVELNKQDKDNHLEGAPNEQFKHISQPVLGFSVCIPTLGNSKTQYAKYVLNKVAVDKINEGEIEDWDSYEEGEID